jgi:hypothetical protein
MTSTFAQSFFGFLFGQVGSGRPLRRPVTAAERMRVLDGTMLLLMPAGQL